MNLWAFIISANLLVSIFATTTKNPALRSSNVEIISDKGDVMNAPAEHAPTLPKVNLKEVIALDHFAGHPVLEDVQSLVSQAAGNLNIDDGNIKGKVIRGTTADLYSKDPLEVNRGDEAAAAGTTSTSIIQKVGNKQQAGPSPITALASSAAFTAGFAAIGVGSDDLSPKEAEVVATISSTSALLSALLPPPFNTIVGTGFSTFGALFGAKAGPTNQDILDALATGFKEIDGRFNTVDQGLAELSVSLGDLTALTRYTSEVVQQIYQAIWVEPFHKIHAAYSSLMETYSPRSNSTSWDDFFEKANILRHELEAEVYDAFDITNIREYLDWYEMYDNPDADSKINDAGKCGQAFLYQYLMTVHNELYLITSLGSFVKSDNCDSEDRFCWEANQSLLLRYTKKYYDQLVEYDQQILNAQVWGGLGIAHLVQKSPNDLLEGVQDGELGFCFQCDEDGVVDSVGNTCLDFKTFQWPTGADRAIGAPTSDSPNNYNNIDSHQQCNAEAYEKLWYYNDLVCPHVVQEECGSRRRCEQSTVSETVTTCTKRLCYSKNAPGAWEECVTETFDKVLGDNEQQNAEFGAKKEGIECCSCSCLSPANYDETGGTGGTAADHETYGRHCPERDELEYASDGGYIVKIGNFRLARIDADHFSISSIHGSSGPSPRWFHSKDLKTEAIFESDGTVQQGVALGNDYNGWTSTTSGGGGVIFGNKAVQIGDWRIRQIDHLHLSISSETGNVPRIYRADGTVHPNNPTYSGYNNELGEPKCAFLTETFLQIGDWRIAELSIHLSVSHRDGKTAMIYRTDGTIHAGPRTDFNSWGRSNGDVLQGSDLGCGSVVLVSDGTNVAGLRS